MTADYKTMSQKPRKLTLKQEKFIDAYLANDGNGTQAVIDAGYKGSNEVLRAIASQNLTKPNINNAIELRKAEIRKEAGLKIKTREERKQFWSQVTDNAEVAMSERLRASELLGKSEGDFAADNAGKGGLTLVFNRKEAKLIDSKEIGKDEV